MTKVLPAIALTPEQRALIRQFSGKDIAEVGVEQVAAGSGLAFADGKEGLRLMNPAGRGASSADGVRRSGRGSSKPRIDPRHALFQLKIGRSGIHGWGVFAAEPIPAGNDVIEYVGEIVDPQECYERLKNATETYAIQLDVSRAIDGAVGGSGAEIINHSCEPNIRYRAVRDHVFCQSIRAIEIGEELAADYAFRGDGPKVLCRCGSPQCRGTINAASAEPASRKA